MTQSISTKIRGLYTFPNDFSSVPEGALSVADNVVIDRDSIAEPRRGFTYLASTAGRADFLDAAGRAEKIFFYDDTIICHVKTGSVYSMVYFNPTDGWHSIAALFNPPSATVKSRAVQANQNLYVTGDLGVHRIDDRDSTPVRVGIPQALDMLTATTNATAPVWLADDYRVAYRLVIGFKDKNGNLYLSAPSGRFIYTNESGGVSSLIFNVYLPQGLTTSHFYQLYRSLQVPLTAEPNDELQLVRETIITAGMIAASPPRDQVIDNVPESLMGASLYTNDSQQGIAAANIVPPKAKDIALYRDFMFYANIEEQQTFFLDLNNVRDFVTAVFPGTPPSTITINGVTINLIKGGAVGFPAPSMTVVSGLATDQLDVLYTAFNLVYAINQYCTGLYATYISGPDDKAGKIVIRSYAVNAAVFSVTSSVSTCWTPPLPVSGTTQSSTAEITPNGLACSKYLEHEHVPLKYRWTAGSRDSEILRVLSLRDSLFILKEDGVYRLWGTDPSNFQVALLDSTANLIAPDSAQVLNNMIFALTTQGVITISETGVTIMSRPIEGNLLDLIQINPSILNLQSFAFASESQRAYYLYLPTTATDTRPTQYYRYNTITNNWTRGTLAKNCGGVNPYDDLIYLGDPDDKYLDVERKSKTIYDYSDYIETETITSVSNKTVTLSNASSYAAGQIVAQFPAFVTRAVAMGAGGGFNETTNEITFNANGYLTGTKVDMSATGTFPVGLSARSYWVIRISANIFKLADTYDLAIAGTPIDFTDQGQITKTATFTPSNSVVWGTITTVATTTLDVAYKCNFTLGSALMLAPIAASMKWVPATFQNPALNKQVREIALLFLADFYGTADVSFSTDASPTTLYETIIGSMPAPWGNFPWGSAPWGGVIRRRPVRVMVPRIHQRCSFIFVGFDHEVAFSPWAIQGISLVGNNLSEKVWHQGNTV